MMIDMLFSWGRYWRLTMSPEEKEKLKHFKEINVREGTPEDLRKVIETFIQQAIIIGEYELDSMPPEYMENLLQTMSKYPEYNNVTLSLMEILKREDLI